MTDWTAGYVADIGYTYGYYTELNPMRMKLPFLASSLVFPDVSTACELGFGQGLSVLSHAAASPTTWYGTDFNPAQAGFAKDLALGMGGTGGSGGSNIALFDQSFAEFCTRPDLPDFDFIGLHGIWSWISDENCHVITDFVRRKLKVGGVLYISYNTQPGWAAMAPMRDLLNHHSEVLSAQGQGTVQRVEAALNFAESLLATKPLYSQANPLVAERIAKMKAQNRNYLAHEYFNRDWHPMSFDCMAQWLTPAKLTYACSAHYTDHVDAVNLSDEQQAFLKEIPDAMFRETVRDFMCNTQFRRDYWVKGARRLNSLERAAALRAQRIILTTARDNVSLKVSGSRGEATLTESVYAPILDILANHKPQSLGQIEESLKDKGLNFSQILQASMVLAGKGDVALVQEDAVINKAKRTTDKLNLQIMNKSRGSNDFSYLASPVIGGAVTVNRFQQLFLLARSQGMKQPAEWAHFVWQQLEALQQRLTKEGEVINSPEENLAELTSQAQEFAEKRLPVLQALHIA